MTIQAVVECLDSTTVKSFRSRSRDGPVDVDVDVDIDVRGNEELGVDAVKETNEGPYVVKRSLSELMAITALEPFANGSKAWRRLGARRATQTLPELVIRTVSSVSEQPSYRLVTTPVVALAADTLKAGNEP